MLETARHYLELKPVGVRSAVQLYKAYMHGFAVWLVSNREFLTIGQFLSRDSLVRYNGLTLYARAHSEDLGYYARITKPWTSKWFKPLEGEIVVDCGSHVGIFAILGLRRGAQVHAFEANPATFQILKKNVELNGFREVAHLYNVALSDIDEIVTLYALNNFTGTTSLRSDWVKVPRLLGRDSVTVHQVPAMTLDHALEGLKKIDWLLIDVEGVEDLLLRGAVNVLHRTRKVIIEISIDKTTIVKRYLLEHGFSESSRGTPDGRVQYYLFTNEASGYDRDGAGSLLNCQASRSETKNP